MLPGDSKIEHRDLEKNYPHECDSGRKDAKNMRKKNPTEVLEEVKYCQKGRIMKKELILMKRKEVLYKTKRQLVQLTQVV